MINHTNLNWNQMEQVINKAKASASAKAQAKRLVTAIDKAADELSSNPFFAYENGNLVILSETSNAIYEVAKNGFHSGCAAHQSGQPCRHRAMRRLLEMYEGEVSH